MTPTVYIYYSLRHLYLTCTLTNLDLLQSSEMGVANRKSGRTSMYGELNDVGGVIYVAIQYVVCNSDVDYMLNNCGTNSYI